MNLKIIEKNKLPQIILVCCLPIVVLFMQQLQEKTKPIFLHFGNMKETVRFPLIWKGIKESVWRFILIFSSICSGCIIIFAFTMKVDFQIIMYGILFSFVNAILEEFIWRGFILAKLVDFANEKTALIISALSFGLYHISLVFPIWACLIFAVGGFYMGGTIITSKGLFAPIIMHIMVNLIFVFIGIIF